MGEVTSTGGTLAYINPFRYKGYYYDSDIKMYYCKSRYYVPSWKRWLNADSPKYLDNNDTNNLNLFVYCGNEPICGYDPNGRWNWKKFLVAAAVSLAVATIVVATCIATAGVVAAVVPSIIASSVNTIATITSVAAITTAVAVSVGAGTESVIALEMSYTKSSKAGINVKGGFALVLDFENWRGEFYAISGTSFGVSSGVSYSVGYVQGYEEPGDYSEYFTNIGVGCKGYGLEHSFDPNKPYNDSVKATSINFGDGNCAYAGEDYYKFIKGFDL